VRQPVAPDALTTALLLGRGLLLLLLLLQAAHKVVHAGKAAGQVGGGWQRHTSRPLEAAACCQMWRGRHTTKATCKATCRRTAKAACTPWLALSSSRSSSAAVSGQRGVSRGGAQAAEGPTRGSHAPCSSCWGTCAHTHGVTGWGGGHAAGGGAAAQATHAAVAQRAGGPIRLLVGGQEWLLARVVVLVNGVQGVRRRQQAAAEQRQAAEVRSGEGGRGKGS